MNNDEILLELKESIGRLEANYSSISKDIGQINKVLILGNGQKSLVEKQANTDACIDQLIKQGKENNKSLELLTKTISDLAEVVKQHTGNKELHTLKGMVSNKTVITWILGGFIFLHTLIDKVPLAWAVIAKFLGLPL